MQPSTTTPLIICFGDSLTVGYQSPHPSNPTAESTPYGEVLQARLGRRARVQINGICGEVTGEMVGRFREAVLQRRPHSVVILGGTNDLGWNAGPAEIMRNLVKLYESARAASIVPVPVTVPSIRVEGASTHPEAAAWLGEHVARRQALNGLIAEYATTHRLPYLDLFAATAEPDSLMLAAAYSNDGLHLTRAGYELFGRLLYERIFAAHPDFSAASEGVGG